MTTKYRQLGKDLLKGKPLQLEDIQICSDNLQFLSQRVKDTEEASDETKKYLMDGLETVVYGNSLEFSGDKTTKNAVWLQIIHRSLDVWDINLMESRFTRKFVSANGQLVAKTQELKEAMHTVLKVYLKHEQDLKTLGEALKIFPEIIKYKKYFPFDVGCGDEVKIEEQMTLEQQQQQHQKVIIKFVDSDMEFYITQRESGEKKKAKTKHIRLRELPPPVQADIICIPIFQQIRLINKVILNITTAQKILKALKICDLWEIIVPPKRIMMPNLRTLENIIMAILMSTANNSVRSISPILKSLECNVGNLCTFVRLLQIHASGKKLVAEGKVKLDESERRHLRILQEVFVEIPEEFRIWDGPVAREYTQLIEKGMKTPVNFEEFLASTTSYVKIRNLDKS